jgi:uncharacterized membrane protein YsdA (DUF1294 family)
MQRHRYVHFVLALTACVVLALLLALWKLGLALAYAWLISINLVTLLLYGHDKRQAVVGRTRVPEVALHIAALLGGSPAALLSQRLFLHKTRKLRFQLVCVAIVLLQIAGIYLYWRYLRG